MTKEELALVIIDRLKKEYPDAGCTLDYNQAWKLLVSVRLAAQCTDARVNIVVEDLYKKFPDVNSLADAPVEEIEAIVKPCGLGHSKARDIKACMTRLKEDYNGNVPDGSRKKERESDHGRCVWKTCHCNRYPLYPSGKPYGIGRWHQRAEKGGNGPLEISTAGRRKRLLPPPGVPWKSSLQRKDKAGL